MRRPEEIIPHRPPWSLIDRVVVLEPGRVIAEKRVSADDPLLGETGLGGPLLIEALAQTAACAVGSQAGDPSSHHGYLVAATGWKFPAWAKVGETVTLTAKKVSQYGNLHGFEGVARVGERELGAGRMSFAVELEGTR